MENLLIFLLLLLLPILVFSSIRAKRSRIAPNLPPGPPGLPIIGNFAQLDTPLLHQYFWRLSRIYGPLIHLKLGFRTVVVANSAKMAAEILKTQDLNFCSRPSLLALRKASYGGFDMALAPYGEYWREMRKLFVLHLLSSVRVKSFSPIREDEVSRMIQNISNLASRSEIVNLSEKIVFLTSTIISRIAFGKRYEQGTWERMEFNRIIREFQHSLSIFYFTDYFPWLGWVDKLAGKIDHLDRIFKKWDSFYQQLIDEHLLPDRPESMRGDVLDILLQLREEGSAPFDISLDHIKATLMNVYFASTDTIGTTMIWAMTALVKNPAAMKAAQAEIRALPSVAGKQMVDEEDLATASLPYFNATIKEILRLYAPLPLLLARETVKNCTIDGYEIPAETMVYVNAWAISRDPEMWENPKVFMPKRFLSEEKKFCLDLKEQDLNFIPFGSGRRGCPGITMALTTLKLLLANLLYAFDWELPDGMKIEDVDNDVTPGISLSKKNPLYVVAKNFM